MSLLSVIVPTFNRPQELSAALKSIRQQIGINIGQIEVIVVNDGGVDIQHILDAETVQGLNIVYVKHDICKKLPSARNTGISKTNSKYICFLDDDDVFLPHHLSRSIEELEKNSNIDGAVSTCLILNPNDITDKNFNNAVIWDILIDPLLLDVSNLFTVHSAVMRNFTHTDARFDTHLSATEDWDMWLQLMRNHNYRFKRLDAPGVIYHRQPKSDSLITSIANSVSNIADFSGTIQYLWDKWPVRSARTAQFRSHIALMYWLVMQRLAQGKPVNHNYYLETIQILADIWFGKATEEHLWNKITKAVDGK